MDFILTRKSILGSETKVKCIDVIGHPCKYAGIVGTIVACDYEEKENPEEKGKYVNVHYWVQHYVEGKIVPEIIEVPAINVDVIEFSD